MNPDQTWHMTTQQQIGSAAGCLLIVAIIGYGFWTLWQDWKKDWSINDLTEDLILGRDNHLADDRASMQAARRA